MTASDVLIIYLILLFVSIGINAYKWKYYQDVFSFIKYDDFILINAKNQQILPYSIYNEYCYQDKVVYLVNSSTIGLDIPNIYLKLNIFTLFDPYSLFWWIKYNLFFLSIYYKLDINPKYSLKGYHLEDNRETHRYITHPEW